MSVSIHVISAQDPIILHSYDWNYGVSPFDELLPHMTHAPATLILSLSWTMLLPARFERMLQALRAYTAQRPWHRFVFLANMQQEKALFDTHHLHSLFCPHNAFLDERLYFPMEREQQWQALINARRKRFKRIHLVQELSSCCFITYATPDDDLAYDAELFRDIPHLHRPQYQGTSIQQCFNTEQLREYYARSACGLILSDMEGGCFSAAEYLLCGLPVVSTPNVGGRNVFFHNDYTYYCHANTHGVRLAVEAAQTCTLSPQEIRKTCLERMVYFRIKYMEMLYAEAAVHGHASTFHCKFEEIFSNKMITHYPSIEDAIQHLHTLGICDSVKPHRLS